MQQNRLYDFISNNYYLLSKEELKDIIKELDYAIYNHDKSVHEEVTRQALEELQEVE